MFGIWDARAWRTIYVGIIMAKSGWTKFAKLFEARMVCKGWSVWAELAVRGGGDMEPLAIGYDKNVCT